MQTAVVLDVLCAESELAEYAQVMTIGESVRRMGVRRRESWFGTGLDELEYRFDRYAEVVGGLAPLAITGEVHAIAAVYVRLITVNGVWRPQAGSTRLEPLRSTARTRRPVTPTGHARADSRPGWAPVAHQEGEEWLWGWRFTLADASVEAW